MVVIEKGLTEGAWMEYCVDLQKQHPILSSEYEKREADERLGVVFSGGRGNIPILYANGRCLAEAWENSLIALWVKGGFVRTQYDWKNKDNGNYVVPPSKDCTMIVTIEEPLSEPMIHKDFPGGMDALEEYRQEVVDGIKDHWVRDPNNPEDKRWEYTYHQRMLKYKVPGIENSINQFDAMTTNIAKSPITRRAQMVTWQPWEDMNIGDPACLQSWWGRILRRHPDTNFNFYSDEITGDAKLNLNQRFRSRDAYRASFMNDFAFIDLARVMAEKISKIRGEPIKLGRFMDMSDSFHIYGSDFGEFLQKFPIALEKRHFLPNPGEDNDLEARTFDSTSPLIQMMFEEARKLIPLKIAEQDVKYAKGEGLTKDSTQLLK